MLDKWRHVPAKPGCIRFRGGFPDPPDRGLERDRRTEQRSWRPSPKRARSVTASGTLRRSHFPQNPAGPSFRPAAGRWPFLSLAKGGYRRNAVSLCEIAGYDELAWTSGKPAPSDAMMTAQARGVILTGRSPALGGSSKRSRSHAGAATGRHAPPRPMRAGQCVTSGLRGLFRDPVVLHASP